MCEIWYYALYPAFLLASRRVSFAYQWKIALVLCTALAVCLGSDAGGGANIYGPWLNWLIALPSWLMGCALAEKHHGGNVVVLRITTALSASVLYWATLNTPVGFYLSMNFFAILVMAWISAEIAAARAENFLDRAGKWSYSIYLFHAIAWTALERMIKINSAFLVPLILFTCYLFYRTIEKPSHTAARNVYMKLMPVRVN